MSDNPPPEPSSPSEGGGRDRGGGGGGAGRPASEKDEAEGGVVWGAGGRAKPERHRLQRPL